LTYQAILYDAATPASVQGDVEWYQRKALERGGPVLELGAGTGRITLAISKGGTPIHALEANVAMLDVLIQKRTLLSASEQGLVTPVLGDMRTFELAEQFALVIAPFRVFLHNVTEDDRVRCLEQVHRHLRPGGYFAFNVFHPSLELMAQHAGALAGVWRWVNDYPLAAGGLLVRSEARKYDAVRQVVRSMHRYDEYTPDGTLARSSLHRLELAYLYPRDIHRLLTEARFTEIEISGGFEGRPFTRDTDELVVEARKPG
jgi:SAM-dependent methyltransferase